MQEDDMLQSLENQGYPTADIVGDSVAISRRYYRYIGERPKKKRERQPRTRYAAAGASGQGEGQGQSQGQLVAPGGNKNWSESPPGYDADLWSEAMYFRQCCEEFDQSVREGLPVVYIRIAEQINRDESFPKVKPHNRMVLVHKMIQYFWKHWNEFEGIDNTCLGTQSLHTFTNYCNWKYVRDRVLEADAIRRLMKKIEAGEDVFVKRRPTVRRPRPEPVEEVFEWKDPMRHGGPGGGIEKAREYIRRRDSERSEAASDQGNQRAEDQASD